MKMMMDRRQLLANGLAAIGAGLVPYAAAATPRTPATQITPFMPAAGKRSRLIFLNDLSGDLDGLFAAVHAILSPSIDLRAIIGTGTGKARENPLRSVELGREILELMDMPGRYPVLPGAASKLESAAKPAHSAGTDFIVAEAMRTDSKLPLFVAVGGGLTEVASALMIEPRIAERMTLVWIGGDAYPAGGVGETNFNIDPVAAQFLFNDTNLRIWQIPRNVYVTCVVSASELQANVAPYGKIGHWLYQKVVDAPGQFKNYMNMGETWTLGDNPLVVLTALGDWSPSAFAPLRYEKTGSSQYDEVVTPRLNKDGTFSARTEGRKMRIYTSIDNRLMFNDLYAKLKIHFQD